MALTAPKRRGSTGQTGHIASRKCHKTKSNHPDTGSGHTTGSGVAHDPREAAGRTADGAPGSRTPEARPGTAGWLSHDFTGASLLDCGDRPCCERLARARAVPGGATSTSSARLSRRRARGMPVYRHPVGIQHPQAPASQRLVHRPDGPISPEPGTMIRRSRAPGHIRLIRFPEPANQQRRPGGELDLQEPDTFSAPIAACPLGILRSTVAICGMNVYGLTKRPTPGSPRP